MVAAVAAANLWNRHASNPNNPPAPPTRSDVASANDTGPVTVVAADPACTPFYPPYNIVADVEKKVGWDTYDKSIPASSWTPEVRTGYQEVGDAMKTAVEQTIPLIKLTPHRVMRELFEQYVAYTRLFIDTIPTYTPPKDKFLLMTSTTIASTLIDICNSVGYGAAAARGPVVPALDAPKTPAPAGDPNKPEQYMTTADSICGAWNTAVATMQNDPAWAPWLAVPSGIEAKDWTPQIKAQNEAIRPVLTRANDTMADLARQTTNPIVNDFAALAVVYGRAYTQGLMSYTTADGYLFSASRHASGVLTAACGAAGVG